MEDRMGGSLPNAILRPAELAPDRPAPFHLEPGPETRAELARELGVPKMRKLRFAGALHPTGKRDWELRAELGATVVQDDNDRIESWEDGIDKIDLSSTGLGFSDLGFDEITSSSGSISTEIRYGLPGSNTYKITLVHVSQAEVSTDDFLF